MISEINNIQLKIKNQKKIINYLYRKLGKITFTHINQKDNSNNYKKYVKETCLQIRNRKRIIKDLEIKKSNIEDEQAKLYEAPSTAPEPQINSQGYCIYKFCAKCQTGNNPDAKICIYCGQKFNK